MTGTTVARSPVEATAGPGMATTGSTTVGMASGGTVGGISGRRIAMTGTTAAMSTVVGTAGPGTRPITAGFMTVGMAASGTIGEHRHHEHRMTRHLRGPQGQPRRPVVLRSHGLRAPTASASTTSGRSAVDPTGRSLTPTPRTDAPQKQRRITNKDSSIGVDRSRSYRDDTTHPGVDQNTFSRARAILCEAGVPTAARRGTLTNRRSRGAGEWPRYPVSE